MSEASANFEAQAAAPCDVCEDEEPGEYYCIECKQTLCPQCEKVHRKVASSKDHNVILRTQINDEDTTISTCDDHGHHVTFYCDKCDIQVCMKCVTGIHKGHNLSDLSDILEKERKMLQYDVEAMQTALPTLMMQREEILSKKENYRQKIQRITRDMEDENKAFINELQRIHEKRVNEITKLERSDMAAFDVFAEDIERRIALYQNKIPEFKKAIGRKSLTALRNALKGNVTLSEIASKADLPHPPTFVQGNLISVAESVGKLDLPLSLIMKQPMMLTSPAIVSKFKCSLGEYPRICITKDNEVWLGGRESRKLVMVNVRGQVQKRRKMKNRPYSLAAMDSGDIIISPHEKDSWSVSKLLKDGGERPLFDALPFGSAAVSVTADQKILICTKDGRALKTSSNGTDVKQIYSGSIILSVLHAVENSDGNIYISDWANHAVVKLGKDGKVMSRITHTKGQQKLGRPQGLAVDKIGNILFAGFDNNCIYIIDQNQQMRELVGRSHGILGPRWLAVDRDSNLWITHDDGNVHVVKYLFV